MNKLVAVALVGATGLAVVVSGCKKKDKPAEGTAGAGGAEAAAKETGKAAKAPKARVDTTSALWALAPESAAFGLVIGDGVGEKFRAAMKLHVEDLSGKPFGAPVAEMMKEMREEIGFDPLDPAGWKSMGIDPAKGMAFYASEDAKGEEHPVLVLPVVDRAAFRAKTKGKTETLEGKEVDRIEDDMICLPGDLYVCGKHLADIVAVKAGETALTKAVKAMPAARRGDVELYVDLTKFPEAKEELAELAPVGSVETVGFAARLEDDGFSLRAWGNGKVDGPVGKALLGGKATKGVTGKSGHAATVSRMVLPMALLTAEMPDTMPAGSVDLRKDLIDQMTGEVQTTTTGKGLLAGTIMLGIEDDAKVATAVGALCELAKGAAPATNGLVAKVEPGDKKCTVELSFATMKDELAGLTVPNLTVVLAVDGKSLQLLVGDVDPAKLAGSAADDAGSAEAKEILGGSPIAAMWTRGLDLDVGAVPVPAELKAAIPYDVIVAGLDWVASTIAEVAFGVTFTEGGAELLVRITTFGGDPPAARAAYVAAPEKRRRGDRHGWKAAVAQLAKAPKGPHVGARAQLEIDGTPTLGLGSFIVGGVVAAVFVGKKDSRHGRDDGFDMPSMPDFPDMPDNLGGGGADD